MKNIKFNKKIIARIAVSLMAVAYVSLVIIQIFYLRQTTELLNMQFDNSVKRAMQQTARTLDEQEVIKIIDEIANGNTPDAQQAKELLRKYNEGDITSIFDIGSTKPSPNFEDFRLPPPHHRQMNTSIPATAQETMKRNSTYVEKTHNLMLSIFARRRYNNMTGLITDRIDPIELRNILTENLTSNEIKLDYHFAIASRNSGCIYRMGEQSFTINEECYKEKLFASEPSQQTYDLVVCFPNKQSFFFEHLRLIIPFVIAMTLLLILCVWTMIYLLNEQRLAEIQNNFVRNMTHELKTPVASISLAAQMLSDPSIVKSDDMVRRISTTISHESKRLVLLIDTVLQTSILDKDRSSLKLIPTDINDLILRVTESFTIKVENTHSGVLKTNLKATDAIAEVDDIHFTNIIFNLMDNAVKYSSSDRPLIIEIKTYNKMGNLNIEISDNGIGIDKSCLKHIFEKYYRVPTGERHDTKGFGLGLAYVHNMVKRHKGTITAESELNIGTKFTISLPTYNEQ